MKFKLRSWKLLLPLAALVAVISITTSISSAAPAANEIRVGIMTDCKGAFGFGYEPDIGGDRELREVTPEEALRHRYGRLARSDAPDRTEERLPLPRRRCAVERRDR